jgi:hypothetical protein
MARARRARGGQSPQRFVLYTSTKFSAKFSTKFSTLMEDGAAGFSKRGTCRIFRLCETK